MPVEFVEHVLAVRGKAIMVSVYDYICDTCRAHHVVSDVPPPPYGTSEKSPGELGWRLTFPDTGDSEVFCPACEYPPKLVNPMEGER